MNMKIEHIIAPPRSGKTTRCVELIENTLDTNPDVRVGYATYDVEQARATVKHLWSGDKTSEQNPFPMGKGTALCGRGFDLIVLDDLIKNADEAKSLTVLEHTHQWLKMTVACRLLPNGRVFSVASDEQQMRMVVSAFGGWGVRVVKEGFSAIDGGTDLEQRVGPTFYRRFYLGDPVFNLKD